VCVIVIVQRVLLSAPPCPDHFTQFYGHIYTAAWYKSWCCFCPGGSTPFSTEVLRTKCPFVFLSTIYDPFSFVFDNRRTELYGIPTELPRRKLPFNYCRRCSIRSVFVHDPCPPEFYCHIYRAPSYKASSVPHCDSYEYIVHVVK
jgi:hypothetical protein